MAVSFEPVNCLDWFLGLLSETILGGVRGFSRRSWALITLVVLKKGKLHITALSYVISLVHVYLFWSGIITSSSVVLFLLELGAQFVYGLVTLGRFPMCSGSPGGRHHCFTGELNHPAEFGSGNETIVAQSTLQFWFKPGPFGVVGWWFRHKVGIYLGYKGWSKFLRYSEAQWVPCKQWINQLKTHVSYK